MSNGDLPIEEYNSQLRYPGTAKDIIQQHCAALRSALQRLAEDLRIGARDANGRVGEVTLSGATHSLSKQGSSFWSASFLGFLAYAWWADGAWVPRPCRLW